MDTLNPVISAHVAEAIENVSVLFTVTTCNTVPAVLFVNTVPVNAGSDSVLEPATAGADMVIVPLVSPEITTDAIFIPYKTTQRLPLEIVTATPLDKVIGPALDALLPLAIV